VAVTTDRSLSERKKEDERRERSDEIHDSVPNPHIHPAPFPGVEGQSEQVTYARPGSWFPFQDA